MKQDSSSRGTTKVRLWFLLLCLALIVAVWFFVPQA